MHKSDLINEVVGTVNACIDGKVNVTKVQATAVLAALGIVAASELMATGEIPLPGLGKLVVKRSAARIGRNPQTGAALDIPARKSVKFRAGKELKNALK